MDFLSIWNNITIEQLAITISLALNIYCIGRDKRLSGKYYNLNTLVARMCDEIYRISGMTLIRSHRSGDYEQVNPLLDKSIPTLKDEVDD